jgi:hypothetical protein
MIYIFLILQLIAHSGITRLLNDKYWWQRWISNGRHGQTVIRFFRKGKIIRIVPAIIQVSILISKVAFLYMLGLYWDGRHTLIDISGLKNFKKLL